MKAIELIALLEDMNPNAEVWINDQQGGYVLANHPYEADGEETDEFTGESPRRGDVVFVYET